MTPRPYGSMMEWDEYSLLQMELARDLDTEEGVRRAAAAFASVPEIRKIEIERWDDGFALQPAPGEPVAQIALDKLLSAVRAAGWAVANVGRKFDPALALRVARLGGGSKLAWRNSWIKVSGPARIVVVRSGQPYLQSVDLMLTALSEQDSVVNLSLFRQLSVQCIAAALPEAEAKSYLQEMR